jgi:hypothetical protein
MKTGSLCRSYRSSAPLHCDTREAGMVLQVVCEYLADAFPGTLLPADVKQRAKIRSCPFTRMPSLTKFSVPPF